MWDEEVTEGETLIWPRGQGWLLEGHWIWGRAHVEVIKRATSMTQQTQWLSDTSFLRAEGKAETKRRRGIWRREGKGRKTEMECERRREKGKEEQHLAWPGYLQGKISGSVGDFLLCFICCGCSAPLWRKWTQHVCDERGRLISTTLTWPLRLRLQPHYYILVFF